MAPSSKFQQALSECGLIAILRGIQPGEATSVGRVLYDAGFRLIEVPLNSPDPLLSIEAIRKSLPSDALVGAGTVLESQACSEIQKVGGELIIMPHSDSSVIRTAKSLGMICTPGVATPTEAFAALAAGADALKMFPAETLGPIGLKAWRAVIPANIAVIPVGGITPESIATYVAAGATGFGLGSALYRPGDTPTKVGQNAQAFMKAWHSAKHAV